MDMTLPTLIPHLSAVNEGLQEFLRLRGTGEESGRPNRNTQSTLYSSAPSTFSVPPTFSAPSASPPLSPSTLSGFSTPARRRRSSSTGTTISSASDTVHGPTGAPTLPFREHYDSSTSHTINTRTQIVITSIDPIRNAHIRTYLIFRRVDIPEEQSSEPIPPEFPQEERTLTTLVSMPPPQLSLAALPTLAPSGARLVAAGAVERVSTRMPEPTPSATVTPGMWVFEEERVYVYNENVGGYVLQR